MDLYSLSDEAILESIGAKIKECRISKNITQAQLAKRSGISAFSISQMEAGHNSNLLSLIMVLRGMEKLELLDSFLQEAPLNPLAIIEWQKKHPQHKRANGNNKTSDIDSTW